MNAPEELWLAAFTPPNGTMAGIAFNVEVDDGTMTRYIRADAVPDNAVAREPNMIELMKEAQAFVERSPLWKRFIDGTPLANDIAVWMARFARDHAATKVGARGESPDEQERI